MRILANENFPREAVEALRSRGHDVVRARTDSPGARDEVILNRANAESRLLVTFDREFGALAFGSGLIALAGIILFRISPSSPSHVARTSVSVIESRTDSSGHFSVVEDTRLRMKPLPDVSSPT